MLTLKEANELNKNNLTIEQIKTMFNKHGYSMKLDADKLRDGEMPSFTHENFSKATAEFMEGVA